MTPYGLMKSASGSLLAYLNPGWELLLVATAVGNTKESADTTPDGPRATVAEGHEKDAEAQLERNI